MRRKGSILGIDHGRPRRAESSVGFIFLTVTVGVMLTTGMVVKGYADGAYTLEAPRSPTADFSFC